MESDLGLEPTWSKCREGDVVDFLAEVIIRDPLDQKHLLLSAAHRTFVTAQCVINQGTVSLTILGGTVSHGKSGFHIKDVAHVMEHVIPSTDTLRHGIEVCAGIRALGEGMEANGFQIKVANDIREKFTQFMNHQGFPTTVTGDIGSHEVLMQIHECHAAPTALAAGFPCQPWSKLGDHRGSCDARAGTLRSILRAAYFLRCHTALLECVTGAREDKKVLQQLKQWCSITKFNAREVTLDLNQIWCAHRRRWWCLLAFPGSTPPQLEPFPTLSEIVKIGDILPAFPQWPEDHTRQLEIGVYEYHKFEECGGIQPNLINLDAQLRTSLHGWGNQLDPCPCGCRQYPMNLARLQAKGLHGALIHLGGTTTAGNQEVPRMRHIHPWELSLLQGLNPNKLWMPHLKLALAGLGQMASPLQSGWIMSQLRFANADLSDMMDIPTPEQVLWNMMTHLFAARDAMFPGTQTVPPVQAACKMIHGCLAVASGSRTVPRLMPDTESVAPTLKDSFDQLDEVTTPKHGDTSPRQGLSTESFPLPPRGNMLTRFAHFQAGSSGQIQQPTLPPMQTEPATAEDWARFESLDTPHSMPSHSPRDMENWQSFGGIPGFQVTPQTKSADLLARVRDVKADESRPDASICKSTPVDDPEVAEHTEVPSVQHCAKTPSAIEMDPAAIQPSEATASTAAETNANQTTARVATFGGHASEDGPKSPTPAASDSNQPGEVPVGEGHSPPTCLGILRHLQPISELSSGRTFSHGTALHVQASLAKSGRTNSTALSSAHAFDAHQSVSPTLHHGSEELESNKRSTTSHRRGRKNPKNEDLQGEKQPAGQAQKLEEHHKQPGTRTPEPEKTTKQPGPRTPEPEKTTKQPASRAQEPGQHEAMETQELPFL